MLTPRLYPGIAKDRGWINSKINTSILVYVFTFCLIGSSMAASMTFGPKKNSFGDSVDKESGWTPIANQIFSHRQQESQAQEISTIIANQRAWRPQPSFPSQKAKTTVVPGRGAAAPIPSATPRTKPVTNGLENHTYRHRPTSTYPQLRRKPMINQRRKNNKKILPSLFLQKVARKVFFPDRRADKDRLRGPKPKLRFDNGNKVLFPVRNSPIQNISNRLRQYLQPVICAFRTESIGLEGERCVQV